MLKIYLRCLIRILKVKYTKFKVSYFTFSSTQLSYSINNLTIFEKTTLCDLGIIFSAALQRRPHYEDITAKAYKIFCLLQRNFKNSISFEPRNYCIYFLVGHACCVFCLVVTLLQLRYFITGKSTLGDQRYSK